MRKFRAVALTAALTAALVVGQSGLANAAPGIKVKGDVTLTLSGVDYELSLNASGSNGGKAGGGYILSTMADANVFVSGKIECLRTDGDAIYLSGPITRDRGTAYGNGQEESTDYIIIEVINGSPDKANVASFFANSANCSAPVPTPVPVTGEIAVT